MKVIKSILPVVLFLLVGLMGQAQVASTNTSVKSETKKATCQKVCKPAACESLVKLGLCTPEEAAKCQKGSTQVKTASATDVKPTTTKVASVSKERTKESATTTTKVETKEGTSSCSKKCTGAKKAN